MAKGPDPGLTPVALTADQPARPSDPTAPSPPQLASRSGLFDQEAERYDRYRPSYPDETIAALLDPDPSRLEVLDVGCGTGICARQIAARGAQVLGVEPAPRMADIARRHSITVEVSRFEDWEPAGRQFDLVTSAQAWHWLHLPTVTAKAAELLRPGGRIGLLWSSGAPPDDLADMLTDLYSSVVPAGTHRLFRGYAANRSTDIRTGLTDVIAEIDAHPAFGPVTEQWYPWTRTYRTDQWLELLLSYSQYTALDEPLRHRLLKSVRTVIDDYGGSFLMSFETVLVSAHQVS